MNSRKLRKLLAFLSGGTPTVDSVLASFQRQVVALRTIAARQTDEADAIADEIDALSDERHAASTEALRANRAADKIESFLL